jgi:hypothetical protein
MQAFKIALDDKGPRNRASRRSRLIIDGGFGGACSHAEAQRALNVHLNDRPSRRTANLTLISTGHAMRAVLPNLIFIPPAVTLQRRILIFWFGPWRDFMNVSKRARGVVRVSGGLVSIVTRRCGRSGRSATEEMSQ